MKLSSLSLLSVGLFTGALILMANSSGVAHQQNKDRTGAPGSDNTCQQCHGGGNFDPQIEVFLALDDMVGVPQYMPGATHTLWIEMSANGNPAGYGVHGTVVFSDGSNAGELIDQDANDCIWLDEVDGRHIFEQNDLCSSGFFEVEWVAPPAGSGPVSVYVAAIAANGNSTSSGDAFVGGQFDFDEGLTSVAEQQKEAFQAFSLGQGQVELESDEPVQCVMLSLDGRVLFEGSLEAGRHTVSLGHTGWAAVRLMTSAGTVWTERIWINA
ncbi:MAG: choice-of-anchor V domain-containing protein [Flavobacteriales bacterium]